MNERQERTADVLGKLTVLGTIVLPLNIIGSLWGMNVKVPGQDVENLDWFYSSMSFFYIYIEIKLTGCSHGCTASLRHCRVLHCKARVQYCIDGMITIPTRLTKAMMTNDTLGLFEYYELEIMMNLYRIWFYLVIYTLDVGVAFMVICLFVLGAVWWLLDRWRSFVFVQVVRAHCLLVDIYDTCYNECLLLYSLLCAWDKSGTPDEVIMSRL